MQKSSLFYSSSILSKLCKLRKVQSLRIKETTSVLIALSIASTERPSCICTFSRSLPCNCKKRAPCRSWMPRVALSREVHTHRWSWSNSSRLVMAVLVQEQGPVPIYARPGILLVGRAVPGLPLSVGLAGRCFSLQIVCDVPCRSISVAGLVLS